jgi:hypothetical protein
VFVNRDELINVADAYIVKKSSFEVSTIGQWDVSQVQEFDDLFSTLQNPRMAQFNEDISHWDVSNIVSMRNLFRGATFSSNLSSWL